MIKLLYFCYNPVADLGGRPTTRRCMARKTGRKLLDRRPVAQPEVQVTTKKISAPKTGINTKKQTFIKNVSKSDQFD